MELMYKLYTLNIAKGALAPLGRAFEHTDLFSGLNTVTADTPPRSNL